LAIGMCLMLASVVPFGLWTAGRGTLWFYLMMPIPLVPATFLLVIWAVVVPACVVEGLGPIASMFRSFDLTKGYRWMIFGISMLTGVLLLAGSLIDLLVNPVSEVLAVLVHAVWIVIVLALWNCTIAATYHDLRVAKEGIDPRRVASIFD
jgi:hypothetical protein